MRRLLLICLAFTCHAADDIPAWLRSAAAEKIPAYDSRVSAVALVRESNVSVDDIGRVITTDRVAIRVLSRAGAREAHALKVYLRDTGKVRDIAGWVIPASGSGRKLGKERILDIAIGEDALYEDIRARVIDAERDCDPGTVFGYESVVEEKSIFTQTDFEFSDLLPSRVSRFSLTLPAGWSSKAITLNHQDISPTESGNTRTWELRDLPWFEEEPDSPSFESLRPRLAVSFFPAEKSNTVLGPSFAQWADVSRYLSTLHDPQAEPDDAIRARVKELTASLTTTADKVRAIATYVQGVRYISIQTGLGRGGGYKPHAASVVFAKSYGDCKDKANLLRAMLRAAGIESWPVSIFSGDPLYVREEWPSPQQFNHCIIAIVAPPGMDGDAIVEDPKLGRLLIFDPTDPYTPVGHIPVHEQNSFALVIAGDKGGLLRMPSARADANSTVRTIDATLASDGSVKGTMREEFTGWTAVLQRASRGEGGPEQFQKRVESRINSRMRNATIANLHATDSPAGGQFRIELDFASAAFAQIMQRRLMVFRPSMMDVVDALPPSDPKRTFPVVINARAWHDKVSIRLPEDFEVDELPPPARLDTAYGTYESKVSLSSGVLTFERTLSLKSMVVAPEDYSNLRTLAEQMNGADKAPVVLAKK